MVWSPCDDNGGGGHYGVVVSPWDDAGGVTVTVCHPGVVVGNGAGDGAGAGDG